MAVPFGFSVGDFVAGIHLLNKAIAALRDSDGANSHFQHTLLELESLVYTLETVQGLQATSTSSNTLNKLHFLAHQCYIPLNTFLTRIKKFEPELGAIAAIKQRKRNSVRGYVQKPIRQIQWGIQMKKHVADLKAAIAPQLEAIEIQLQLINLEQQNSLHDRCDDFDQDLSTRVQAYSDMLNAKLADLSTAASMNIALQSLDGLHSKIEDLKTQGITRVDYLQGVTYPMSHACGSTRAQYPRPPPENCSEITSHELRNSETSLVIRRSKGALNIDTTKEDIVSLLRDGVDILFLQFWIVIAIMRHIYGNVTIIARLPSMLLSSNIEFEDVLGRTVFLPYEHFKYLPVFLARLRCSFRDFPGPGKLARKRLPIERDETRNLLRSEIYWRHVVRPGIKLRMIVVCSSLASTVGIPLRLISPIGAWPPSLHSRISLPLDSTAIKLRLEVGVKQVARKR